MRYGPYKRLPNIKNDNFDGQTQKFRAISIQQEKQKFFPDSLGVATGCYLDLEPEREDDLDRQGDLDLTEIYKINFQHPS